ncbi:MAG: divergent polysaccharide deacetylase family protein [Candidatus Omnitrophica bacterium]|nr:divergent polysaccharide deacetylase family protein [Candidatus Omnitrophota bacterium]MDD5430347.1 divergent polysaccharide deacetylase family protein [Candidatus Omnitrophota bacterium]
MGKNLRIILLIFLIIGPIVFYHYVNKKSNGRFLDTAFKYDQNEENLPEIALIFDDLGENLSDLKELYSLDVPLTVSVIPDLKFSKNIAHIASRCGFSVFIHLPMQPLKENTKRAPYRFIGPELSRRENVMLLRHYLNSLRIAIGVNNHMGSAATQDVELMKVVLRMVKARGLIFIDSKTSPDSVAYEQAQKEGLVCGYNEGFLDYYDSSLEMEKSLDKLINSAVHKGRIIAIAHPKKSTIRFLKGKIPELKKKIKFITIQEYFES